MEHQSQCALRINPGNEIEPQHIWQLLLLIFVVCSLPAQTPLVNHSDSWRYRKGTSAPQSNWKTADDASLDGSWLTGHGGFGYADNTTETSLCQTILSDTRNT